MSLLVFCSLFFFLLLFRTPFHQSLILLLSLIIQSIAHQLVSDDVSSEDRLNIKGDLTIGAGTTLDFAGTVGTDCQAVIDGILDSGHGRATCLAHGDAVCKRYNDQYII